MSLIKLIAKAQPLIVVTLLVTFMTFFGFPAYVKFTKMEVFTKEYTLASQPLEAPAVTICLNPVRL